MAARALDAGRGRLSCLSQRGEVAVGQFALAEFHLAAVSFPLADNGPLASAAADGAIGSKVLRWGVGPAGGRDSARRVAGAGRAGQAIGAAGPLGRRSRGANAASAVALKVPIQPCIGDIWHDHILFLGDGVSGLVDFGGMRADTVAGDIARLLGSLVADDPAVGKPVWPPTTLSAPVDRRAAVGHGFRSFGCSVERAGMDRVDLCRSSRF